MFCTSTVTASVSFAFILFTFFYFTTHAFISCQNRIAIHHEPADINTTDRTGATIAIGHPRTIGQSVLVLGPTHTQLQLHTRCTTLVGDSTPICRARICLVGLPPRQRGSGACLNNATLDNEAAVVLRICS